MIDQAPSTPVATSEDDLLGGSSEAPIGEAPTVEAPTVEPEAAEVSLESKDLEELTDADLEGMIKDLAEEVRQAEYRLSVAKEDYVEATKAMQGREGKFSLAELNKIAKRNTRVEDDRRRKAAQAVRTLHLGMKRRRDGTSGVPTLG